MLKGASIKADATPEYLGVGYIIGPRVAGVIFAGGVFSWLVLMPLIYFFGKDLPSPIYPGTIPIAQMGPSQLWSTYIRPMGAGAVAAAGLITLLKTLPTIIGALTSGLQEHAAAAPPPRAKPIRTEHDLSMSVVVIGSIAARRPACSSFSEFKPVPGAFVGWVANLAASLLVVVFGFLFVTVSSRIVGLVGTSANPISGMTIATLMATAAIFLVQGWTAPAFGALAITIGGVVCIAAANAGDTSQDLKTGYIIGATPRLQQMALMIGVVVSTVAIGFTLNLMNTGLQEFRRRAAALEPERAASRRRRPERIRTACPSSSPSSAADNTSTIHHKSEYIVLNALGSSELADGKYLYSPATGRIEVQWIQGIGSEKAAAPQARLMATVINGILSRKLPWGLVMLGVFLVIAVELLGIRSLSFAVGAYLLHRHHPRHLLRRRGALDGRPSRSSAPARRSGCRTARSLPARSTPQASSPPAASSACSAWPSRATKPPVGKRDLLNFPHTFLDHTPVSVFAFLPACLFALLLCPQAVEKVIAA